MSPITAFQHGAPPTQPYGYPTGVGPVTPPHTPQPHTAPPYAPPPQPHPAPPQPEPPRPSYYAPVPGTEMLGDITPAPSLPPGSRGLSGLAGLPGAAPLGSQPKHQPASLPAGPAPASNLAGLPGAAPLSPGAAPAPAPGATPAPFPGAATPASRGGGPPTYAPFTGSSVQTQPYAAHDPAAYAPNAAAYAPDPAGGNSPPPVTPARRKRPSGWNAPAYGMLGLFLVALAMFVVPQYRARQTEAKLKPLVVGLVGHQGVWARCPRYLTSVLTNVGSVSLDSDLNPSDHTNLTGPICKSLKHMYTPEGRAEMACLTNNTPCSQDALNSVIAMSTITHESMHLRGEGNESMAECYSVQAGEQAGVLAGLTPEEGRMIGYLHLMALNPDTPPQYHLSRGNCQGIADLLDNPPGDPAAREALVAAANTTWRDIASG